MANSSSQARHSALATARELARRNCAASDRPLSPMMKTAVTARALAGDGKDEAKPIGAVPEASD
jgi:hypothetical protein